MNSNLWLHVFQYCSFNDLLVTIIRVSKEWKSIVTSKAANVQLWMRQTQMAMQRYFKSLNVSSTMAQTYVDKDPVFRFGIRWM